MTVSKEELFARYKQLKSEGVNITLMELKKQMEAEEQSANPAPADSSLPEQTTPPQPSGFGALSQNNCGSLPSCDNNFSTPQQPQGSSIQPSDYGNTQPVSSWSTTYLSGQQQPIQPTQPPVQPKDEVNEAMQNRYANNFTSNFTYKSIQTPQPSQVTIQTSVFQPVVTNTLPTVPTTQNNEERTKYCLIGYPLGHSLSTYIHEAGFKSLDLNYSYEILETPPESLVDRVKFLKYNNFAGFNITIPLKLPITMFLDEIDMSADLIGAVNTVVINPDRTMKGYNTDVLGFRNAIPKEVTLAGKTIGILGTGGAARAAITAFALEQVKQIKIFTRNIPNASELLNYLRSKFPNIEFTALQIERIRDLSDIDILVNTTPIGMQGRAADLTPVEENELKTLPQGAIVYDVIYNPKKTILLKLAQKNGYKTINGVDMFIHQAVAAEEIWTGKTPDFKDMKIAALENL